MELREVEGVPKRRVDKKPERIECDLLLENFINSDMKAAAIDDDGNGDFDRFIIFLRGAASTNYRGQVSVHKRGDTVYLEKAD